MEENMKYNFGNRETRIVFSAEFSFPEEKGVVIIDQKVLSLFEKPLQKFLEDKPIFVFEATEKNKNLQTISTIYDFFQKNNVNRSTVIYGIGGGITTDVAGFAASTYMRGCRLTFIPTTFLGMIDATLGGKTAVNFRQIKNNIGTFYPAEKIFLMPEFLKTLSVADIDNGWAECLKIALIRPSLLFEMLLKSGKVISPEIIRKAVELKAEICQRDPFDKSERRFLNLGHTFAHIYESLSNFNISHGTAVAAGIRTAATLSLRKKFIDEKQFIQIIRLLDLFRLRRSLPVKLSDDSLTKVKEIISRDKKNTDLFNLILFNDFQSVFVYQTSDLNEIINAMKQDGITEFPK